MRWKCGRPQFTDETATEVWDLLPAIQHVGASSQPCRPPLARVGRKKGWNPRWIFFFLNVFQEFLCGA
jgi:hypothetical protein